VFVTSKKGQNTPPFDLDIWAEAHCDCCFCALCMTLTWLLLTNLLTYLLTWDKLHCDRPSQIFGCNGLPVPRYIGPYRRLCVESKHRCSYLYCVKRRGRRRCRMQRQTAEMRMRQMTVGWIQRRQRRRTLSPTTSSRRLRSARSSGCFDRRLLALMAAECATLGRPCAPGLSVTRQPVAAEGSAACARPNTTATRRHARHSRATNGRMRIPTFGADVTVLPYLLPNCIQLLLLTKYWLKWRLIKLLQGHLLANCKFLANITKVVLTKSN